jgi:hypothetical protein
MKRTSERPTLEDSPLLQAMSNALETSGVAAIGLRVSVTQRGEWYEPAGETDRHWVKWLSWSVVGPDGGDVTEPVLAVVHGDFDEQDFAEHLRTVFPNRKCTVDNDIVMPA